MSYSRWSNSTWYTFWSAFTSEEYKWPSKKLKNSQVFEICDLPSYRFTYGELQDLGIYAILKKIKKFYSKQHSIEMFKKWKDGKAVYRKKIVKAKNPTEEEMLELVRYIREWEKDVEEHFKFWTFIRYEWWYPIRNKILNKIKL